MYTNKGIEHEGGNILYRHQHPSFIAKICSSLFRNIFKISESDPAFLGARSHAALVILEFSMIVPRVMFVSETAVLRTWSRVFVTSMVVAIVPFLPALCLVVDGWSGILVLLTLLHRERVVEIVYLFRIVCLWLVRIEAFANGFLFSFLGIGMTA